MYLTIWGAPVFQHNRDQINNKKLEKWTTEKEYKKNKIEHN